MFAARYFAPRYFAPRYFPEVGSDAPAPLVPDISYVVPLKTRVFYTKGLSRTFSSTRGQS